MNVTAFLLISGGAHFLLANADPGNATTTTTTTTAATTTTNTTSFPSLFPINLNSTMQLVIYDPQSGRELETLSYLPKVLDNSRQSSTSTGSIIELPQIWNPCLCADFACDCCLGLRIGDVLNQRFCVDLLYNPALVSVQMRITHNAGQIANLEFSPRDLPAYCIPIWLPLPLFACLRLYDISAIEGNVNVCLALMLNVFTNPLLEYRMDCISFGANGPRQYKPLADKDAGELRRDKQPEESDRGISLGAFVGEDHGRLVKFS